MTRARFSVVPSAYVILVRDGTAGPEVLLQRRQGTTYLDGWWACGAAGHVEPRESVLDAAVREAREELGVTLDRDNLEPLATMHRTCALPDPIEQRFDVFFTVRRWGGDPRAAEADRAAAVQWWPLAGLPERVVPHERRALLALASGDPPVVLSHGFSQSLTLVAAVGRNGAIGDGERLPWHLPEDLAHFKAVTMGGVLLMGRRTFDSIGRALPGRRTIVLTRDTQWAESQVEVARSLAEALLIAGDQEVFVVGGGEVYRQTMGSADRLVITDVDSEPEAEVLFPTIDPARWVEVSRVPGEGLAFVDYARA